ncbi:diguanylate cyclase domain-containing protein [Thioalkalivibrio sulfidiphilus]|uniref:diguanylate cyclase domain-containing protein n=1 Tax=Thioalkalivibrio sulfidiphilus TaxID=1033854 RepID=UPI003B382AE4
MSDRHPDRRRPLRGGLRLQTRVTLWLLPMIVAPLLLLGWLANVQLHDQLREQHLARMDTLLEQMDLHMQSKIRTAEANARLMMSNSLLQNYMRAEDEYERYELLYGPLLRLLDSYQQAHPDLREVRLALADGTEDVRWVRAGRASSEGLPTASLLGLEADGAQLVHDAQLGESLLMVSRPVMLRDVRADPVATPLQHYGYLLLLMDLSLVQEQMFAYQRAGQGNLLAVNHGGEVLLAACGVDAGAEALLADLPKIAAEGLADLRTGDADPVIRQGRDYIRVRALYPDHLWLGHVPGEQIAQATRGLGWLVLLVVFVATAGTFLMVLLALRVLVLKPLATLERAALRIGEGSWDFPALHRRGDEIGGLMQAFEQMVDRLQDSHQQIHHMAYHDELTGLANRKQFNDHLSRAVDLARRQGERFAVLFLDLDRFKDINDTHGHDMGDRVLRHFAELVSACVRDQDYVARGQPVPSPGSREADGEMVARLGGDEFIVLLRGLHAPADVLRVTGRILQGLEQPFVHEGVTLMLRTSIGVAFYPQDGDNAEQLMQRADFAMYRAKQDGTHRVWFYRDALVEEHRDLMDLQ